MNRQMPSFPVPIIRLILPRSEGSVLILHRSGNLYSAAWCLPGGKVDYGDTVEQTIRKELKEETDLTLTGYRFLFLQDCLPLKAGVTQYLNLYFECQWEGTVVLNDESVRFAWVTPETIVDYEIAFKNDEALRLYWSK
jgi:8-oxo-dGTP pyrophosphatase MutT (NUDIX family)